MPGLDDLKQELMEKRRQGKAENSMLDMAKDALEDEKEGQKFYTKMLKVCNNPQHHSMISEALADERKHEGFMRKILNA